MTGRRRSPRRGSQERIESDCYRQHARLAFAARRSAHLRNWLRIFAILAITLVSCAATSAEAVPHWHAHDAGVSVASTDVPEALLASVDSEVHGLAGMVDLPDSSGTIDGVCRAPQHARTVVPPTGLTPIAPFQPPRA